MQPQVLDDNSASASTDSIKTPSRTYAVLALVSRLARLKGTAAWRRAVVAGVAICQ